MPDSDHPHSDPLPLPKAQVRLITFHEVSRLPRRAAGWRMSDMDTVFTDGNARCIPPAAHRLLRRVAAVWRVPRAVRHIDMDPPHARPARGLPALNRQQGHARDRDRHVRPCRRSESSPLPRIHPPKRWLCFVLITFPWQHICFDVQRALDGFITHGGTPTGTLDFYFQLSNPTEVGKSVIYVTQTLVGDAFVVRASPSLLPLARSWVC